MSFRQPNESTTLITSSLLWMVVLAVLNIGAPFFRSSEAGTILGGLVGSLLFFFQITFIGSIKRDIRWVETIFSLIITAMVSSSVHRVSGTTSILFSIGFIFYFNYASEKIYSKLEESHAATTGGKKRK